MQPNPNPFDAPSQSPEFATPAQRSVAPKVMGILNLVFAFLGILGAAASGIMLWRFQMLPPDPDNSAFELMQNPGYRRAILSAMPLGLTATLCLAVSGVGLIRYRRWGRSASFFYIGLTVLNTLVGVGINYVWIMRPMLEQASQPDVNPVQVGGAVGGILGGLFGSCIALIYPLVLLIFMNLRHVVDSLE